MASGKGAMTEFWIFISRLTGSYPLELSAIASGECFILRKMLKLVIVVDTKYLCYRIYNNNTYSVVFKVYKFKPGCKM